MLILNHNVYHTVGAEDVAFKVLNLIFIVHFALREV